VGKKKYLRETRGKHRRGERNLSLNWYYHHDQFQGGLDDWEKKNQRHSMTYDIKVGVHPGSKMLHILSKTGLGGESVLRNRQKTTEALFTAKN